MKKFLLVLLVILIVIQFFQPKKNRGPVDQSQQIETLFETPDSVAILLKDACRDCHSNNTDHPWYSYVQPFAWWLADHIEEGKGELNLDEFGTYDAKKQDHKLEEVVEMIEKGAMPLKPYPILHKGARLSDSEKAALIDWAKKARAQVGYSGQG